MNALAHFAEHRIVVKDIATIGGIDPLLKHRAERGSAFLQRQRFVDNGDLVGRCSLTNTSVDPGQLIFA